MYRKALEEMLEMSSCNLRARLAIYRRKGGEGYATYEEYYKKVMSYLKLADLLSFKLTKKEAEDLEKYFTGNTKEERLSKAEEFLTDLYCTDINPKSKRLFNQKCLKIAKALRIKV